MGRVARLRKLTLRVQRQESLELASQNLEARKAEIRRNNREEKAQKMADEFGISKESAMKVLIERKKEKKEKKETLRPSVQKNKLQSVGTRKGVTAEGKEN